MDKLIFILLYAGLLVLIFLAGMRIVPFKPAWKLLERGLLGAGVLFVWNLLAAPLGLAIGLNPLTAIITGALGAPGLGLLLVIKGM